MTIWQQIIGKLQERGCNDHAKKITDRSFHRVKQYRFSYAAETVVLAALSIAISSRN